MDRCNLCEEFAQILGGMILSQDPCTVLRLRDINATILGRSSRSSLTRGALFSFESPDAQGRTLNLGETVILQDEINPFISALREQDIFVTALHNHWLFDEPRLFYIHFDSIDDPIEFARKTATAFELLTD
ncbi:MAG TPA: hypothetical protein DCY85_01815 [Firmicutes bacterium]|jgi:hypothetical protein|nr:hypothetical protein [Bacillota bacterium]HBE05206.1 hypothetical protein [Bacillota bacterium]HCT37070.1 hypothetical protein [Bacillota bacterium]